MNWIKLRTISTTSRGRLKRDLERIFEPGERGNRCWVERSRRRGSRLSARADSREAFRGTSSLSPSTSGGRFVVRLPAG